MSNSEEINNSAHCKTIFKQTFKFTGDIPKQRISPEGFLIRDCGCVMRFLPNSDNKVKLHSTAINKNQSHKNSNHTHGRKNLSQTKMSTEISNGKNIEKTTNLEKFDWKTPCNNNQHTMLYQSTFWMEPRMVPVKYTTEINFELESPTRKFTETIDLQIKLVPCPYIQQIGTTTRFKT